MTKCVVKDNYSDIIPTYYVALHYEGQLFLNKFVVYATYFHTDLKPLFLIVTYDLMFNNYVDAL